MFVQLPNQVVWRKVPDTNPLTIGTTTWVDDPRIFVDHTKSDNQWDLVIEDVTSRDAGEYECQVSISKKLLRHVVELFVIGEAYFCEGVKIYNFRYFLTAMCHFKVRFRFQTP